MDSIYIENFLTKMLDAMLKEADSKEEYKRFALWAPIPGLPGSGKTATVRAWLEYHVLKNVFIDATTLRAFDKEIQCMTFDGREASDINEEVTTFNKMGLTTKKVKTIFDSMTIDNIDRNTIVVIDNYDKASKEVREELFKYIHFHELVDARFDNEEAIKRINPLMLLVIIDTAELVTKAPLTKEELHLFGLDEYIQYIK